MVALRTSSTQVYVGWRLLGNDPSDVGFNLYRSANGGAAVKVNSAPLTNTTDYVDTPANLATTAYTYSLKPVQNGVEVPTSGPIRCHRSTPPHCRPIRRRGLTLMSACPSKTRRTGRWASSSAGSAIWTATANTIL
jgi:hypothetical protein